MADHQFRYFLIPGGYAIHLTADWAWSLCGRRVPEKPETVADEKMDEGAAFPICVQCRSTQAYQWAGTGTAFRPPALTGDTAADTQIRHRCEQLALALGQIHRVCAWMDVGCPEDEARTALAEARQASGHLLAFCAARETTR